MKVEDSTLMLQSSMLLRLLIPSRSVFCIRLVIIRNKLGICPFIVLSYCIGRIEIK